MRLIWYDAIRNEIFESNLLDGLFFALSIRPEWWDENKHIDVVGFL